MKRFDDIPQELLTPTTYHERQLIIRRARQSDMRALHGSCFADRSPAQFADSFRRSLQQQREGRRLHLVVLQDGEIVASGQLTGYSNLVEIADLAVAPGHRGKGIGTALIGVFEQVARYTGYSILELGVMQENHQARALYGRLGFVEDRQVRLGDAATALVLRKSLDAG